MRRGRLIILILLLLVVSAAGILLALNSTGALGGLLGGGGGGGDNNGDAVAPGQTAIPVTATPEPALQIIAAVQNLERGAIIPTEAIGLIPWPTQMVPPSVITDPADVVGARARYTIARGEPIFSTMIVESLLQISPYGSDAAAQIPPGFVGISIPYDRLNGVAYGVKDGDHVNVIVSWAVIDIDESFQTQLPNLSTVLSPPNPEAILPLAPSVVAVVNSGNATEPQAVGRGEAGVNISEDFYVVPSEPQRPRLVTQGIIQDALVLHVGDFGENLPEVIEPTATPNPDPAAQPQEGAPTAVPSPTPAPPDIITLVVSPQDALVLNYVNRMGERFPGAVGLTLVLRSAGDTSRVETESVTLQYMFDRFQITMPSKLNYGLGAVTPTAVPPAAPAP
jgi:pilus assembly protein CpaB